MITSDIGMVFIGFYLSLAIMSLCTATLLHAKIQVCMSVCSAVRVATDRQTYDVKTTTPDTSQTAALGIASKDPIYVTIDKLVQLAKNILLVKNIPGTPTHVLQDTIQYRPD